jgi:hypothetical protein
LAFKDFDTSSIDNIRFACDAEEVEVMNEEEYQKKYA